MEARVEQIRDKLSRIRMFMESLRHQTTYIQIAVEALREKCRCTK